MLVVLPYFFAGEKDVDRVARFALRPVDEHIDVEEVMIDEAGSFESGSGGGQIGAPDQEIDVARSAHGVLVDPADPLGDGVATGDGVGYAGRVERRVALRRRSLTFSAAMSALSQPLSSTAVSAMTNAPCDFCYCNRKHEVWRP